METIKKDKHTFFKNARNKYIVGDVWVTKEGFRDTVVITKVTHCIHVQSLERPESIATFSPKAFLEAFTKKESK